MAVGKVNIDGGKSKLNVFTGLTEPKTKEGVWIKTEAKVSKVINELELWLKEAWNNPDLRSYAALPAIRGDYQMASVGRKIYLFGGVGSTGTGNAYTTAYCYDIDTNSWSTIASLPSGKSEMGIATVGTDIYIIGGRNGTGASVNGSNTILKYDTLTDTYTTMASIPRYAFRHRVVVIGTKIYIIGGYNAGQVVFVHMFDTIGNTWTTLSSIPRALYGNAVVEHNGMIYSLGGSPADNNLRYLTVVLKYNVTTDTWTEETSLPIGIECNSFVKVGSDVYIFNTNPNAYKVYKYNFPSGILEEAFDFHAKSRTAFSSVFVDNRIWVVGGAQSITYYSDVRAYAFTSKIFDEGTFILHRPSEDNGTYRTELVTPKHPLLGAYPRMTAGFSDAYIYNKGDLQQYLPTYYGDGKQWIKFKN